MARDKKTLRYSYRCKDASKANFLNKNFNKTESYNSSFAESIFRNTSLVGTKFKFCNLNKVIFDNCLVQGTLFRKCPMAGVKFQNCIIISVKLDRTSLESILFENSIILSTHHKTSIPNYNLMHSEVIEDYYDENEFSIDLLKEIESLKRNQHINRSSVLHRKKGKLNTIAIKMLLRKFGEEELMCKLPILGRDVKKDFYTLSYLIAMLHKISINGNVSLPGPLQHRKYQNEKTETSLRTDAG